MAKVHDIVIEDFIVFDDNNLPVTNIQTSDCEILLFDPAGNEVSNSITVIISELGYGVYRSKFVPNSIGTWFLLVKHPTYFPWGKASNIEVSSTSLESIADILIRILGLVQENFAIDNTLYDDNGNMIYSRIRIYSNEESVGTEDDVITEYDVNATYTETGQMLTYQVKKVI